MYLGLNNDEITRLKIKIDNYFKFMLSFEHKLEYNFIQDSSLFNITKRRIHKKF